MSSNVRITILIAIMIFALKQSVTGLTPDIKAGYSHTVALHSDGTVWTWGLGGLQGNGSMDDQLIPRKMNGLSGIVEIACGDYHTLALKDDGTIWAWGNNQYGQLGDSTTDLRLIPTMVSGLQNVVSIAAGGFSSVAITSDSRVWIWGDNDYGQLANGISGIGIYRTYPTQIQGLTNIRQVSCGENHIVALKNDGTVWAWGQNDDGQLGDGTWTHKSNPVQVINIGDIRNISTGGFHSFGIENDSMMYIWGNNGDGQLGNSSRTDCNVPILMTSAKLISGGGYHSIAIRISGELYLWGDGFKGQIGDGGNVDRLTPIVINSVSNVIAIAGGAFHTACITADGKIWTWGFNNCGQLGDSSTIDRSTPVQVNDLTLCTTPGFRIIASIRNERTGSSIDSALITYTGTSQSGQAYTNVSGIASIDSVPAGVYSIRISKSGYADKNVGNFQVLADANTYCTFTLSPVDSSTMRIMNLAPNPNTFSSGVMENGRFYRYYKVVDASGNAAPGVTDSVNLIWPLLII